MHDWMICVLELTNFCKDFESGGVMEKRFVPGLLGIWTFLPVCFASDWSRCLGGLWLWRTLCRPWLGMSLLVREPPLGGCRVFLKICASEKEQISESMFPLSGLISWAFKISLTLLYHLGHVRPWFFDTSAVRTVRSMLIDWQTCFVDCWIELLVWLSRALSCSGWIWYGWFARSALARVTDSGACSFQVC
jgi:hypothetical protein